MKRLLLLSNSTNPGERPLQYATPVISEFFGPDITEILFIPYAGVGISYDDYTARVAKALGQLEYEVKGIHQVDDAVAAVKTASAVAVGGGNTFALLNQLYQNALIEPLQQCVNEGIPFMGWSAGSNIASPTIKTTNDMPIVAPPTFEALNLVPFQINPHYTTARLPNHGGETRPDRIKEFLVLNPDLKVAALPEGNLLRLEGDMLRFIGPDEWTVFDREHTEGYVGRAEDISFLLR